MGYGDELMASAAARRLKEQNPDAQVVVLAPRGSTRWSRQQEEIFRHNPYITAPERVDRARPVLPLDHRPGSRPYIARTLADGIAFSDQRCEPGDLFFAPDELRRIDELRARHGSAILLHPEVKRSLTPNNKDWEYGARPGERRWVGLVERLAGHHPLLQIGADAEASEDRLPVPYLHTATFREACMVLAAVRGLVTTEGGLHHAAGALRQPAVVIFGGRTSPRTTGYSFHRNLYRDAPESPCGKHEDCPHCRSCMERITVEDVFAEVRALWPLPLPGGEGG